MRDEMSRLRLERLINLRRMKAPPWVIRSEQVALLLNKEGLKHAGIGKRFGKRQRELYVKFVTPLMSK